jgi:hypothetical protein
VLCDDVRCCRASAGLRATLPSCVYVQHALRVVVAGCCSGRLAAPPSVICAGGRDLVADRGGGPVVSR